MKLRNSVLSALLLAVCIPFALGEESAAGWKDDLEHWRTDHAARLSAPDGWLTVVGLEWLHTGDNSVGSATDNTIHIDGNATNHLAILRLNGEHIRLLAPREGFPKGMTLNGKTVTESDLEVDGAHPSTLHFGDFTLVVIHRGEKFGLRIRNASAPARLQFHGLRWYPPDPSYRITAEWIPYKQPRQVTIQNVVGISSPAEVAGEAHFQLHGVTYALLPVVEGKTLFFVLRDETSRSTTYQASRFLNTPLPDNGIQNPGTVVLDFNRLVNPPCAFTAYATCPLPLNENKLQVEIPVGELRYEHNE